MQFSAAQIAMIISGKIEGNADTSVASFGKIEEAQKGQLAFGIGRNAIGGMYYFVFTAAKH